MPTNYNDNESLELYIEYLTKLYSIVTNSSVIHLLIAGDFNCCNGTEFYNEFHEFVRDNNLIVSEMTRLHNVHTFISDDGTRKSWIDHVLSSATIDKLIRDRSILDDIIVSDYKLLSFTLHSPNAIYSCMSCRYNS